MRNPADAFRECLEKLDVPGARRLWAATYPGQHQPRSDEEMLQTLHLARTQARTVRFSLRAYSHAWLRERDLPSMLPDADRPRAERMYPRVVEGVGIAVMSRSPEMRPIADMVRRAMETVVMEMHADGVPLSSPLVGQRMQEARKATLRKLIG